MQRSACAHGPRVPVPDIAESSARAFSVIGRLADTFLNPSRRRWHGEGAQGGGADRLHVGRSWRLDAQNALSAQAGPSPWLACRAHSPVTSGDRIILLQEYEDRGADDRAVHGWRISGQFVCETAQTSDLAVRRIPSTRRASRWRSAPPSRSLSHATSGADNPVARTHVAPAPGDARRAGLNSIGSRSGPRCQASSI